MSNQTHSSEPLKLVLAQFIEFLVLGGRISPLKSGTVTTEGSHHLLKHLSVLYYSVAFILPKTIANQLLL